MKKVVTEKEDEFLYPGDVWSGFLGRDFQNKVEDFLRKGVAEAKYKDMKLIYNELYTFLEWKPKGSPIRLLKNIKRKQKRIITKMTLIF